MRQGAKIEDNSVAFLQVFNDKVKSTLLNLAKITEDNIAMLVPVKTGATRDSRIHILLDKEIIVGVDTPYAASLETGTSIMSPRPFLVPAAEAAMSQGIGILK